MLKRMFLLLLAAALLLSFSGCSQIKELIDWPYSQDHLDYDESDDARDEGNEGVEEPPQGKDDEQDDPAAPGGAGNEAGTAAQSPLQEHLVGIARQMAQSLTPFTDPEHVALYATQPELIEIAVNCAIIITEDTPTSVVAFRIAGELPEDMSDMGSITTALCTYPSSLNNALGSFAAAAASLLTQSSYYPLPAEFSDVWAVEIDFNGNAGMLVVFSDTGNSTMSVLAAPILPGAMELRPNLAEELTNVGMDVSASQVDPNASCDLPFAQGATYSTADLSTVQQLAVEAGRQVGLLASEDRLLAMDFPPECIDYALNCDVFRQDPFAMIVWDLTTLDGALAEMGADATLAPLLSMENPGVRFSQLLPSLLCGNYIGSDALAAQSALKCGTSYLAGPDAAPVMVWLFYGNYMESAACAVTIAPNENGCLTVSALPLMANDFGMEVLQGVLAPSGSELQNIADTGDAIAAWFLTGTLIPLN